MSAPISAHAIAPAAVMRGEGAWAQALPQIARLSRAPLLLGRSSQTERLRDQLFADLQHAGLSPRSALLHADCCEQDLQRLASDLTATSDLTANGPCSCDAVIGKDEAKQCE